MMQASETNESASDSSKTGICITVKVLRLFSWETHVSHLNVTGSDFSGCQFEQQSHTV